VVKTLISQGPITQFGVSASKMTYIVSGGALDSTHSLPSLGNLPPDWEPMHWGITRPSTMRNEPAKATPNRIPSSDGFICMKHTKQLF